MASSSSNWRVSAPRPTSSGSDSWRRSVTPRSSGESLGHSSSSSSSFSPSPSPSTPPPTSSSFTPEWRRRKSSSASTPGAKSTNWRSGSPPTEPLQTLSLRYDDLSPGDVVSLPVQQPPSDSIIFEHAEAKSSSPWGHPVVITNKFRQNGMDCVHVWLCTTFGGRSLEEHKQQRHWQYFAMVDNDTDTERPASVPLLTMAPGGSKFAKRTYVNLSPNARYPIEACHLESWCSRKALKFDGSSTEKIVSARWTE